MSSTVQPVVIRDGAFRADPALLAEIATVAADSFLDTTDRLTRELDRCDTLYLLRGPTGELDCFFLVAHHHLDVGGHQIPALYLGLSAARPEVKGTGLAVRLYDRCAVDARGWERAHGARLVAWAMTVTPGVYRAACRVFAGVQPDLDGEYTPALRRRQPAQCGRGSDSGRRGGGGHPFVLPGVAGVRYTDGERRRTPARPERAALFGRLGVEETRGDRLLLVAQVPDAGWRVAPEAGMSRENAERSRRWFEEVWNLRRAETIDEFLTPESVGHMEGGDVPGVDAFKAAHAEFVAAFPDLRVEVEAVLADGDDVAVRWRATASHAGDGLGLAGRLRPEGPRGGRTRRRTIPVECPPAPRRSEPTPATAHRTRGTAPTSSCPCRASRSGVPLRSGRNPNPGTADRIRASTARDGARRSTMPSGVERTAQQPRP
ncbi:ester cyclase [bacterium]|nr:ester cyclase [bacterium]